MKIILTCGHPYSGHQTVAELLNTCGLGEAMPSRTEKYSPEMLQNKIFEVYEWDADGNNNDTALPEPGKVWQEMASDLLIANLSQPIWGWADSQTVWLLEFWKNFDPQIRFILVYSAPEFVICNMLQQQVDAPESMDDIFVSWQRYNAELLRFYNRNRDRCLLVNAQTTIQQPVTLLDKMTEAFAVSLQLPDDTTRSSSSSRVAAGLACSLITHANPTEENPLYQELESTADIISSGAKPSTQDRLQAWAEYNSLISELKSSAAHTEQQRQELEQLNQRSIAQEQELQQENKNLLTQLHQLHEELEQFTLDKQSLAEQEQQLVAVIEAKQQELEALKTANTELEASNTAKQELEQENELLLLQLHQVQEELEQYFLNTRSLTTTNNELRTVNDARLKEIDRVKAVNKELSSTSDARLKEIETTKSDFLAQTNAHNKTNRQLESENKFLLQQIQQVEAELKKCAAIPPPLKYEPIGIRLDLRSETFPGDNWYHAEHDGRWSGPGLVSTIEFPPLKLAGECEILLDVVDAIAPDIMDGMQASLNGTVLHIQPPETASTWKQKFKKTKPRYPRNVRLQFKAQDISGKQPWHLQLHFPKVISPSQNGIDPQDMRKLGIRLRSVILKQM